jgi:amino acid permease
MPQNFWSLVWCLLLLLLFIGWVIPVESFSPSAFTTTSAITIMVRHTPKRRPLGVRSSSSTSYTALDASSSSTSSDEGTTTTTTTTTWDAAGTNDGGGGGGGDGDIEFCELGVNTVYACETIPATQTQWGATTNLAKCICGAGSFALPYVFLQQGLLGGILSLTLCGGLAAYTMISLAESQEEETMATTRITSSSSSSPRPPIASYVELTNIVLGKQASQGVFFLTLCAALGVCSTYLVFIGQTLESMATTTMGNDNNNNYNNVVQYFFPNASKLSFEIGTVLLLLPLCLIRDYSIFAFTSALGVLAVVGGMAVTVASGLWVDPGWQSVLATFSELRLWPESWAAAFGTSFGTVAYLFCINFLTFPILNSMQDPKKEYAGAVTMAVSGVWIVNVIFAILCLAFFGNDTQDLVLSNLGNNGPYLSALKLFLCVDLACTFPIVFSSARQILQGAFLERPDSDEAALSRVGIVVVAVSACLGLAQIGGFGTVANLVGGVAQGTLAFVVPPAIAIAVARNRRRRRGGVEEKERRRMDKEESTISSSHQDVGQWLILAFGVVVVSSVTYFTIESAMVATV